VTPVIPLVDGIVTSPGQVRVFYDRTRKDAAVLLRADWTNALRGPDFVLPPETIQSISLLDPQDALDLGASALVLDFLLGYEEEIEAACLRTTVQYALAGSQIGMPLLVDVQPFGPRVVLMNKAIELGVSYALEVGADGIAVPWPGRESFETIITMAAEVPVWVKVSSVDESEEVLPLALELGATGFWLGEGVFAQADPAGLLETWRQRIHPEG
jgi:DhnA family fructose-bisphosphate aldolase class Ia